MSVHKVNGENPVTYSELLLAAQKLERWVEARDSLLPKSTTGSNITHSHSQGNLFPPRKLKGSCTFRAQSAVVEDPKTENTSGPKPNGEKEAKSSAEEDVGISGEVGGIDLFLVYITWCAKRGRVILTKEPQLLQVWQPGSPDEGLPKGSWVNCKEGRFNLERGNGKEGKSSQKSAATQQGTLGNAPQA